MSEKKPAAKRRPLTDAEKAARAAQQAAKFQELANKRVPKALKQIQLIGNLSMSGYRHTPEQLEKIRTALTSAVEAALARFDSTKREAEAFRV